MKFGLREKDLVIVRNILDKYFPDQTIWIFGSRVTGSYKEFSDLDIAILSENEVNQKTLAIAKEEFVDSNIPISVDLVDYNLTSGPLREAIDKKHKEF